jgi:hypothetical protein
MAISSKPTWAGVKVHDQDRVPQRRITTPACAVYRCSDTRGTSPMPLFLDLGIEFGRRRGPRMCVTAVLASSLFR